MNKYLKFEYWNTCDLGNIYYQGGQHFIFYLDADVGEPIHEEVEEGQENGDGDFIPTYRRQMKRYRIRTGLIPDYLIDAIQRMKLHDHIELTFKSGEVEQIYNIDVEPEWQFEKYAWQGTVTLTFDMDESITVGACCDNLVVQTGGGEPEPESWDTAVDGVYYVKNGGDDDADGLTDSTAWASISKVNTVWADGGFSPGNIINFRRGHTWSGTITVTESGGAGTPITISAYHTGAAPIIEGFTTLSSWTSVGGNIYYATLSGSVRTEMVTINGVQYAMGRWPNAGTWNTVATRPSTTEITDTSLTGSPDWDGAELVIRQNRWMLTRHTITDHTNTSIQFSPALNYNPVGYGYFIQNHLSTLTNHGEWFHDTAANRLYIYLTSAPSSYIIRASSREYGVNVAAYKNIKIENIQLRGFNKAAVYANYGDYDAHGLTINGCTITFSGGDAIYINRSSGDTIKNNTISYSNHAAITLWGNFGTSGTVTGNTISYTGTIPGAAFNSYGATLANNAYNAIYVNPNGIIVANNNITFTGYIPINYRGTNALIEENYISHYAYVKDDAGGIYVYDDESTGKQVLNNIILYGIGATEGMPVNTLASAHGLYTDGESTNVLFDGNIVGHMVTAGYHGNLPRNVTITNNRFFDCAQFLNMWKYGTGVYITDMDIQYNHFVSSVVREDLPCVIHYINSSGDYYTDVATEIAYFGTINNNNYFLNTECAVHLQFASSLESAPKSMARWIADYGHDAASTVEIMTAYTLNSVGPNLLTNGDFTSNINGWSGTSGCTPAWDNTDELGAGGSLQLTSTQANYNWYWWSNDNAVTTAISGGVVDSDNHYILRFLGKSAIDEKTVSLRLRSTGTGYTSQRFFTIGNTNTQKDVLYSNPPAVASGATMRLVMCDDPVVTYLDNVELYVADVTLTVWTDYIHLLYNNTSASVTYTMSATMEDPEGNSYNSITLQPFTGIILIGYGTIS
jgi:parallel beta-helix repeat protein